MPSELITASVAAEPSPEIGRPWVHSVNIGVIAFLTLVDLFATQAILPSLAEHYRTTPAATGLAVNASTFGMAIAGLVVALFGRHVNRRRGVVISLALLSVPTLLLSLAPTLTCFLFLRIVQGLLMATAFSLSLAYIAERGTAMQAALGSAAYVTGNVASNLIGRLVAAAAVDHVGLAGTFELFATLNLVGAVLAVATMRSVLVRAIQPAQFPIGMDKAMIAGWRVHLMSRRLRAAFMIGFCILFAFIGTFTYVNFVLVRMPFDLHPMQLGLVYFVFLPSLVTTPLAGLMTTRYGTRPVLRLALLLASLGLPCLLSQTLPIVLLGLALVAVGTFFAQAIATSYVGRHSSTDRSAAGGLYLTSYFLGGLASSFGLGQVFDHLGWPACVFGVALALAMSVVLAGRLTDDGETEAGNSLGSAA